MDELPITDEEIRKRIKSYQIQDSKAGIPIIDLTIEEVKVLLSTGIFQHCEISIKHGTGH